MTPWLCKRFLQFSIESSAHKSYSSSKVTNANVDSATKNPARARRIQSEFIKGNSNAVDTRYRNQEPLQLVTNISIAEPMQSEKSYNYSADDEGKFAISYAADINVMGNLSVVLINSISVRLEEEEYELDANPSAEFLEIFIKNKTNTELIIYYKQSKNVVNGLIIFLSLLVVYAVYGLLTKDNNVTNGSILFVSLFCFGILPHQFKMIKKIEKEIKDRKLSNF